MKKLKTLLTVPAAIIFFVSCSKTPMKIEPARPIDLTLQTRAILKQNNSFSIDFFKAVSQQHNNNLFLSPYSMSAALGMLYNGAAGETKAEIAKVLGMSGYTPEDVNKYYQELTKALLAVDPNTSLSFANAIWANKGVALKKSFVDLNKSYYDAEVSTLDFSQPSALKTINDWSSKKTKGTIPKLFESMPYGLAILANAIYFKSFWTDAFDKSKTVSNPFYNIDGSISTVPMMHQKELQLWYAQTDVCDMVSLPYTNKAFAMNFILPSKGVILDELVDEFNGAVWQTMMAHRVGAKVTLSMPRFKIENSLDNLVGILAAMGMPLAFSPDHADFSAMLANIQTFFVSDVFQKSYISVDEKGTEAAAVTVFTGTGSSGSNPLEVTIVLDCPFIFAITEQSTGAILFMGKVTAL